MTEIQTFMAHPERLRHLFVFDQIDSTSTFLWKQSSMEPCACVADMQTAAYGRRGTAWLSPAKANIYLSLRFATFPQALQQTPYFALCCGVAVVDLLRSVGAEVYLKWPNDILDAQDRKLAGILIETRLSTPECLSVVVGIGINHAMPPQLLAQNPLITDCQTQLAAKNPVRAKLTANVLDALLQLIDDLAQQQLRLPRDWSTYDRWVGQPVQLILRDGQGQEESSSTGIYHGIDAQGHLLLATTQGLQRFHSSLISLRRI